MRGWRCRRRERAGTTAHRRREGDDEAEEGGGGGDEERARGAQAGPRTRGETRGVAGERGRREEAAAREAGRWDCRALF